MVSVLINNVTYVLLLTRLRTTALVATAMLELRLLVATPRQYRADGRNQDRTRRLPWSTHQAQQTTRSTAHRSIRRQGKHNPGRISPTGSTSAAWWVIPGAALPIAAPNPRTSGPRAIQIPLGRSSGQSPRRI